MEFCQSFFKKFFNFIFNFLSVKQIILQQKKRGNFPLFLFGLLSLSASADFTSAHAALVHISTPRNKDTARHKGLYRQGLTRSLGLAVCGFGPASLLMIQV
jgi:hypothetical protein